MVGSKKEKPRFVKTGAYPFSHRSNFDTAELLTVSKSGQILSKMCGLLQCHDVRFFPHIIPCLKMQRFFYNDAHSRTRISDYEILHHCTGLALRIPTAEPAASLLPENPTARFTADYQPCEGAKMKYCPVFKVFF
jgi:hypothetical protein